MKKNEHIKSTSPINRPIKLTLDNGKVILHPVYQSWRHMTDRCYDEYTQAMYSWVVGSTLCEEWHDYNKYYDWRINYELFNCCVDKDLKVKGNKHYSPETCVVLPRELNSAIHVKNSLRSQWGYGVTKVNGYYKAAGINKLFENAKDAAEAYIEHRHTTIDKLANKYLSEGVIDLDTYCMLIGWTPR